MPNQRSKNKVYLGGFIHKDLHARIMRMAKRAGMANNKFGFVAGLVEEAIARRRRRKPGARRKAPPKS